MSYALSKLSSQIWSYVVCSVGEGLVIVCSGLSLGGSTCRSACVLLARCGYWGCSVDPFIQSQSGGMVTPQSPPGTIYNSSPGRPSPGEVVQIPDAVQVKGSKREQVPWFVTPTPTPTPTCSHELEWNEPCKRLDRAQAPEAWATTCAACVQRTKPSQCEGPCLQVMLSGTATSTFRGTTVSVAGAKCEVWHCVGNTLGGCLNRVRTIPTFCFYSFVGKHVTSEHGGVPVAC